MLHRVFITYHHENDQDYKESLVRIGEENDVFLDGSVDTGDISDELSDESIRTKIRDEYLRDTTVTILLVGLETMYRKHVDWEIYSSMYDGKINKKSGIVVVNLPEIGNFNQCYAPHGTSEKQLVYPDYEWAPIEDWREFRKTYPYVPDRIVDSLANGALISVSPWHRAAQPDNLRTLVELAYRNRKKCKYDTSRHLRRRNG